MNELQISPDDPVLALPEGLAAWLLAHVQESVVFSDLSGKVIYWNHGAEQVFGHNAAEMVGRRITERASPELRPIIEQWLQRIAQGENFSGEWQDQHKDGHTIWVEVNVNVVRDVLGNPIGILGTSFDITRRHLAEQQLRLFESFVRQSNEAIVITEGYPISHPGPKILFVNDAFCRMTGYTKEEILGQTPRILQGPKTDRRTLDRLRHALENRQPIRVELLNYRKDRSEYWAEIQIEPVTLDADNGPTYWVAVQRDITEQKQQTLAKERMARLMRETEQSARIGNWEYDVSTGELFWTDQTYRLHDLEPGSYRPLFSDAIEFYVPEHRPILQQALDNAITKGEDYELELELVTVQNRRKWVRNVGRVIAENGKTVRLYGSIQDITPQRQAQAEREQFEMYLRETQKLECLGVMAAGLAHQFNNLLTGIMGNAELTASLLPKDSTGRVFLRNIDQACQRAAELCRQLLAFAGKGYLSLANVDLNDVVRACESMIPLALPRESHLLYDMDSPLPTIEGDSRQLQQSLINLVQNAGEALPDGAGRVLIRTGRAYLSRKRLQQMILGNTCEPGLFCFWEVADNGVGIPQEHSERLFVPFFSTKFIGRGLGISAVLGIVRSHHGCIEIESQPRLGTSVRLWFPVQAGTGESPSKVQETQKIGWVGGSPFLADLLSVPLHRMGFSLEPIEASSGMVDWSRYIGVLIDTVFSGNMQDSLPTLLTKLRRQRPILCLGNHLTFDCSDAECVPFPYRRVDVLERIARWRTSS